MKYVEEDQEQDVLEEITTPVSKHSAFATSASDQVKTSGRATRKANKSTLALTQESSSSPLSECPSDISDWEMSNKVR